MLEQEQFTELIRRVRAGDEQAAAELVRSYESELRLEVRVALRLRDPRVRRVLDSMDICQSVLASFFVRAATGQYDLERPEQLLPLLLGMARNKLAEQVRRQQRQRRDIRRTQTAPETLDPPAVSDSPSDLVAGKELLAEFRKRLSDEERRLADLRTQGQEWTAIAATLGGTPEGRRKQLARAVDRVAQELGLDSGVGEARG
jgi:RNA polymerase sigma-70 factor (ECF subfamily)